MEALPAALMPKLFAPTGTVPLESKSVGLAKVAVAIRSTSPEPVDVTTMLDCSHSMTQSPLVEVEVVIGIVSLLPPTARFAVASAVVVCWILEYSPTTLRI